MWNWGNVLDEFDKNASRLESGDSTLSPGSGTIYVNPNFLDTKFCSFLGRLLCRTLASKRRALPASLEPAGTGACPTERVTFCI